MDERTRQRIDRLRRAGVDYIARARLNHPLPDIERLAETASEILTQPAMDSIARATPHDAREVAKDHNVPTLFQPDSDGDLPRREQPFSGPALPAEEKKSRLAVLRSEVSTCRKCTTLAESRIQTVFSDGSAMAELCFVGEAPGADEDQEGVPFVGRAGQLLTKIIEACALRRDEVYICNVLKCRPPGNRNPEADEIDNCNGYLHAQLELVRPRVLVALGRFPAAFLLGKRPEDVKITHLRGEWHSYRGIKVMPTLHPSYLLRNPSAKRDVWEDMKTVMRELGRPVG